MSRIPTPPQARAGMPPRPGQPIGQTPQPQQRAPQPAQPQAAQTQAAQGDGQQQAATGQVTADGTPAKRKTFDRTDYPGLKDAQGNPVKLDAWPTDFKVTKHKPLKLA